MSWHLYFNVLCGIFQTAFAVYGYRKRRWAHVAIGVPFAVLAWTTAYWYWSHR